MMCLLTLLMLASGGVLSLAPPESAPPSSPDRRTVFGSDLPSASASAARSDQPTAEDLLRALQRERPLNEVIPPGSAKGGPWPKTKRKLLPEGSTIIDRSGVVVPDGDGWRFRFDGSAGEPSYPLLPNALLGVLIHAVDADGQRMPFEVSGEVTTFADENFLLLRGVSRTAPSHGGPPSRKSGAGVQEGRASSAQAPAARFDADAADVLKVLSEKQPTRTIVDGAPKNVADPAARRGRKARPLLPDGSPLVDRPGRVLREGTGWVFVPETDRPDRAEPELRLLPNQMTESIGKSTAADTSDLVFVLSGEVTQFQGENYLLPRAVMRRLAADNLRK